MKKQTRDLLEAIQANIKLIDENDILLVMHDYKFELGSLIGSEDIEGLKELLSQTESDIIKIYPPEP